MAPGVTPATCADGVVTPAVLTPQGPARWFTASSRPARSVLVGRCRSTRRGDVGDGDGDVDVAGRMGGRAVVDGWGVVEGATGDVDGAVDGGDVYVDAAGGDVGAAAVCRWVGDAVDGDAGGRRWGDLRPGCG